MAASRYDSRPHAHPVIWLSGEIVTFFNKIGAVLWLAAVVGALSAIFLKTGRISISPSFRPVMAFVFLATVFIVWLSVRIQRVGYVGRDLIVSNYLRQERIPFDQVEAAEPVWWYYRRMVRVRLRSTHPSARWCTTFPDGRRSSVCGPRLKRNYKRSWRQIRDCRQPTRTSSEYSGHFSNLRIDG